MSDAATEAIAGRDPRTEPHKGDRLRRLMAPDTWLDFTVANVGRRIRAVATTPGGCKVTVWVRPKHWPEWAEGAVAVEPSESGR